MWNKKTNAHQFLNISVDKVQAENKSSHKNRLLMDYERDFRTWLFYHCGRKPDRSRGNPITISICSVRPIYPRLYHFYDGGQHSIIVGRKPGNHDHPQVEARDSRKGNQHDLDSNSQGLCWWRTLRALVHCSPNEQRRLSSPCSDYCQTDNRKCHLNHGFHEGVISILTDEMTSFMLLSTETTHFGTIAKSCKMKPELK